MKTLLQAMRDAREQKRAIGHFNISDSTQLHAIVRAARELGVPVVIGASEGERDFVGMRTMVAMVHVAREQYGMEVYANADHMHSVQGCIDAIDAGCDSVIFDGSKETLEKNIQGAREVVAYAQDKGVVVEAEVGYIGTSSKMLDDIPEDVLTGALPTPEDVADFVTQTGITAVAPAVGNLHGMLKGRSNPSLHIDLIEHIRALVGDDMGVVLHGGSGLTDEDFTNAIHAGMNVVHINTEIRVAYRSGIEKALAAYPDEVAPYRYLNQGGDAVYDVVKKRLALFNNM